MKEKENPLFDLEINGGDYNIRGNITLASECGGKPIIWKSSNEAVVSTQDRPVEDKEAAKLEVYKIIPKGVVTRQQEDVAFR